MRPLSHRRSESRVVGRLRKEGHRRGPCWAYRALQMVRLRRHSCLFHAPSPCPYPYPCSSLHHSNTSRWWPTVFVLKIRTSSQSGAQHANLYCRPCECYRRGFLSWQYLLFHHHIRSHIDTRSHWQRLDPRLYCCNKEAFLSRWCVVPVGCDDVPWIKVRKSSYMCTFENSDVAIQRQDESITILHIYC